LPDYKWNPITPLSDQDRIIDLAAIGPLYESWKIAKEHYKDARKESLERFAQRLVRRLSIETGILERLYDLDRGTTEALVAYGFAEELISRSSTDVEPSRLIDILRDQEGAIQLVMDCVARHRPVTKGFLHELHTILTRHQETTTAVDQFGNRLEIPLLRGQFKQQPNNPRRPDGTIHEYCPPIHVDAEVENLLRWLQEYEHEDPVIVAAWLHHRFTQIHPYQDGNGRVGRALTTLVLLRADLLPLIIDRDIRLEYIDVLERADFGDLGPLARLVARLERTAILQALSADVEVEAARGRYVTPAPVVTVGAEAAQQRALTAAVIDSLATKFQQRRAQQYAQLRKVNDLAQLLRDSTRQTVAGAFEALKVPVSHLGRPEASFTLGGPEYNNAHWYKYEVIHSSESSGKFINFSEDHYFVKASIRVRTERLVFVASFHHVGRELTGIMEVTAFARLESFEGNEEREFASHDFFPCSLEPFVITWKTNEADVATSYEHWLDAALAVAIKEYGDRL
jgi:5-carboxymethyl-2-hydroxymuconate isomerase